MSTALSTTTMTVAEVIAESVTRMTAARDAIAGQGHAELASEVDDMLDDIRDGLDLDGPDRAVPVIFAALLGVTLGDG